jgi:hypothetical protein
MSVAQDRVGEFLEGTKRNRREIVTPEGVALPVDLAEVGERSVALVIDMFIWLLVTVFLYVAIIALVIETRNIGVAVTLVLFIAFLVRNLYFIYFELVWQGVTPGKRLNGLARVPRARAAFRPRPHRQERQAWIGLSRIRSRSWRDRSPPWRRATRNKRPRR